MYGHTKEYWVGFLIVLAAVSGLFLALQVSGLQRFYNGSDFELKAFFDDIGGLKPRARITMSGVTVGRIASIQYDPVYYRAEVRLSLGKQMRDRIPDDSAISIRTAGLLGDNYLAIEPGGSETMMQPGALFAETHSALVLERLVSQFLFNKDK